MRINYDIIQSEIAALEKRIQRDRKKIEALRLVLDAYMPEPKVDADLPAEKGEIVKKRVFPKVGAISSDKASLSL